MGPNEILDKSILVRGQVPEKHFVKLTGVEEGEVYDGSGYAFAVAQEGSDELDVERGRHIRIRVEGISSVVAAGAIAINDACTVTDNGRVESGGAGQFVGRALTPADGAGEWVSVQLAGAVAPPAA